MLYQSLREGLNSIGKLIPYGEPVTPHIRDNQKDYYVSLYQYDDNHKKLVDEKGSFSGIDDTTTDRLFFDFDSANDLELARKDALTVYKRLLENEFNPNSINIFFSGSKGFSVELRVERRLNKKEFIHVVNVIAGDLSTFDKKIFDSNRIVRLPDTKHQTTGLYKIALSPSELERKKIENIRTEAINPTPAHKKIRTEISILPAKLMPPIKVEHKTEAVAELDLERKPSNWKNCKWSLLQGNFKNGERDHSMTILGATCKGLGYDKETTYYMCKSALKKSWAKHGEGGFQKEELWNNILHTIFDKENWRGGQFTCSKDPWLHSYCKALGDKGCKVQEDETPCIHVEDMHSQFTKYAVNFEQNIIRTGIAELDDNAILFASTLNGLLGQPGAGKSTVALNYLRNTSLNSVPSIFLSLDMGMPLVFAKLIQKRTGEDFRKVLKMFKENPARANQLVAEIKDEYKHVGFNFKAGLTVDNIRDIIAQHNTLIGKPTKLVIIDYLECLAGPYSDPLANMSLIANKLKDLANEMSVCILLLLQTQKHSTPDISDPLTTLKAVKGSSTIEQSMSVILTLWREGYNPDTVDNDKYISFAVVKNRFGSLWKGDFNWNGVTGSIEELSEEERYELKQFLKKKKENRAEKKDGWE